MESGIEALNKIKETRDRFLAMQKLSKEIFNETISRINELKQYHEDIASNKRLIQKKRCAISQLETSSHLMSKRITTLETILKEKKQCVQEQDDLLKKDQQDILSARSSYCDRVYEFIEENQGKSGSSSRSEEYNSVELNNLSKQVENFENELRALNERILVKESALKEIQSIENTQQQEELKYQQILDDRKETLKNLMQQVKHLKFIQRKHRLNNTIENLYQQNSTRNFPTSKNDLEGETSNYFTSSTSTDQWKQNDALNKIKNLRTIKNEKSNFKSSVPVREVTQTSVPNVEEFSKTSVKRFKISEETLTSANRPTSERTSSLVKDSCRVKKIQDITKNNRRKFTPKKPFFSQKLK